MPPIKWSCFLFVYFLSKGSLKTTWSWSLVGKRGLRIITLSCQPWSFEHIFWSLQGQQGNTFVFSGLFIQIHLLHAFSSFLDFQESVRPRIFICFYCKTLQCSKGWILSRSASLIFYPGSNTVISTTTKKHRWFQGSHTLCYNFFPEIP